MSSKLLDKQPYFAVTAAHWHEQNEINRKQQLQ
jgi:hypothetical protein